MEQSEKKQNESDLVEQGVSCVKATKLTKGCVVMMKSSSKLVGYGNPQCVSSVCEPLGTISLYGHNQHYKDYDVKYPSIGDGEIVQAKIVQE